ncbi:MAG TPA: 3-deoxy-manno-octulosonate cytidylyltransferase [bacterium]|nr:3-deoxy-manno-octulosonate cytidylyltransferase [bacterium]
MSEKIAIGIIPARYEATRFPGKPLFPIAGKPLIQHVYEQVLKADKLDRAIVATDDERIYEVVESFGGRVVMTRRDHATGTDRIAEVAQGEECDIIVNVQGDEPLMDPGLINRAVEHFGAIPDFRFGSAMTPIETEEDIQNPNVVKVVVGQGGQALYFSRFPLPYRRKHTTIPVYQHIGFYVYSREFVLSYSKMSPTPLEQTESLEQLRAIENGIRIDMIETKYQGIGVDAPEDVARIEWELKRRNRQ